jgi:hypothetical protein
MAIARDVLKMEDIAAGEAPRVAVADGQLRLAGQYADVLVSRRRVPFRRPARPGGKRTNKS